MPLLDHFHPPLAPRRHWESFHVNWAGAIADALNESLLPEGYFAEEHARLGPCVEIDVATFTDSGSSGPRSGGTATLSPRTWAPPAPAWLSQRVSRCLRSLGVRKRRRNSTRGGDRAGQSRQQGPRRAPPGIRGQVRQLSVPGISLIVIDIVTSRQANLHNEICSCSGTAEAFALPPRRPCTGLRIGRSSATSMSRSRSGRRRWRSASPCPCSPWR